MTLFSDWLRLLHVPYTEAYSDSRFRSMSFRSLYGLGKLMQEYGVGTRGVRLPDKGHIAALPVPFVAPMRDGSMVIHRHRRRQRRLYDAGLCRAGADG